MIQYTNKEQSEWLQKNFPGTNDAVLVPQVGGYKFTSADEVDKIYSTAGSPKTIPVWTLSALFNIVRTRYNYIHSSYYAEKFMKEFPNLSKYVVITESLIHINLIADAQKVMDAAFSLLAVINWVEGYVEDARKGIIR